MNRLWYFYNFAKTALFEPALLQRFEQDQLEEFLEIGLELRRPNTSQNLLFVLIGKTAPFHCGFCPT